MSTHVGIGFSNHFNPEEAFKEAAIAVKTRLNQPSADLVIVTATPEYADAAGLAALHRILKPTRLIGATTSGVIADERVEAKGVSILGVVSDEIFFKTVRTAPLNLAPMQENSFKLARDLMGDHQTAQRQGLVYFIDGIKKNNTPFLRGLQEGLGRIFPIIGGIVCENAELAPGKIFWDTELLTDVAATVLMSGQLTMAIGSAHGWRPLGKPRIITSASGNVIKMIDNKPAVSLYEDYFKDLIPKDLSAGLGNIGLLYPLGLSTDVARRYTIRNPVDILSDGSIVSQGEIREGARVHLMIGDKDACRRSTHEAATMIRDAMFGKTPKILLVLESLARRKILGRSAAQEIHLIKEIVGHTTQVFGLCTFGEIAPPGAIEHTKDTDVQNQSIVLMGIG
ncbi:MAG: FIST C-terminal domain-containing protein [Candidatus Omnitrophica bacterium]|nr:FIST C-terminal domain-containing protein [Candidatus Omnitrophota bacterium]